MSHETAVAIIDNDGDANRTFRSFGYEYVTQLLKEPMVSPVERVVEYGVNVSDGSVFPWNPFERNFRWHSDAEDAAREYLRDNPEEQSAELFELVIENDEIISSRTLNTIYREDLVDACVPQ